MNHTKIKYIEIIPIIFSILFFGCQITEKKSYLPGVSKELAQMRFNDISEVSYLLDMEIPDSIDFPIMAKSVIQFTKRDKKTPLVLDFVSESRKIFTVLLNDEKSFYQLENEHLIIPSEHLNQGKNKVEVTFEMGEGALNRNKEYLYSLFVPDRARTVIPCFDQPDIKAQVSYSIRMPKDWTAITNGQMDFEETVSKNATHVTFATTKPISTYLWGFAVGKFHKITVQKKNLSISLFHMEKDLDKLKGNMDAIFEQVEHSLQWMEKYTDISYPFQKYDLVCIPSFQFAGMEHPGAVYYRNEMLFLGENPTKEELLKRAQLIAHETAHMWFGDLVTMKWFSGVWQKEVFANFMADKMVKEQFPDLNHDLTFLINHFPPSYSVDRTEASNAIEQQLDNLKDASSMYGTIIYHKAPIVMNQLEQLMGEDLLQEGLSKYLSKYKYSNASWSDLINILNDLSEYDIELWSSNWVNAAGRPVIEATWEDEQFVMKQHPEYADSSIVWPQRVCLLKVSDNDRVTQTVELLMDKVLVDSIMPDLFVPSLDAQSYGLFKMDTASINYCFANILKFDNDVEKGAVLINLYENFLDGSINPEPYFKSLQNFIAKENNEQLINLACSQMKSVYWKFLSQAQQSAYAEELENCLWYKMKDSEVSSLKKSLLMEWSEIVSTQTGLERLYKIVMQKDEIENIKLSDRDISLMTFELVLRDNELADNFVKEIANQIQDEDVRDMMLFVSPVFSKEESVRTEFIESLNKVENRKKENWVLTALAYFHHAYHKESNVRYLSSALELTTELKETGSLFFPMNWIQTVLAGYGSEEVIEIVTYFFKDHPQYPQDLKQKMLQALDMVKRRSLIVERS